VVFLLGKCNIAHKYRFKILLIYNQQEQELNNKFPNIEGEHD
jgi:hypothetical protein